MQLLIRKISARSLSNEHTEGNLNITLNTLYSTKYNSNNKYISNPNRILNANSDPKQNVILNLILNLNLTLILAPNG